MLAEISGEKFHQQVVICKPFSVLRTICLFIVFQYLCHQVEGILNIEQMAFHGTTNTMRPISYSRVEKCFL